MVKLCGKNKLTAITEEQRNIKGVSLFLFKRCKRKSKLKNVTLECIHVWLKCVNKSVCFFSFFYQFIIFFVVVYRDWASSVDYSNISAMYWHTEKDWVAKR